MTSIGHTGPAGVIDSFNYTLDNNGNRTAVTSNEGTESYTLDGLNRITAAAYPDGGNEAFSYDAAGNRTSHTQTDGATVNFNHDAARQLVSDSTGVNYTYDGAGNLTGTSAGDTYTYNAWLGGRLQQQFMQRRRLVVQSLCTVQTQVHTSFRRSNDGVVSL